MSISLHPLTTDRRRLTGTILVDILLVLLREMPDLADELVRAYLHTAVEA